MLKRALTLSLVLALLWGGMGGGTPVPPYHNNLTLEDFLLDIDALDIHKAQKISTIFEEYLPQDQAEKIALIVVRESKKNDLDPYLLSALILVESNLNPTAISNKGAVGLAQIMPTIWHGVYPKCGKDLFNPQTNLCYSAKILSYYRDKYNGDMKMAVRAYGGLGSSTYYKVVFRKHESFKEWIRIL